MVRIIFSLALLVGTILILANFASAGISLGNLSDSIDSEYLVGESLRGWLNISFADEPINSVLTSSLGGSINLTELFQKDLNIGFIYRCSPISCGTDYTVENGESAKTINLDENETVLIGFNISTKYPVKEISSFSFNLTSNNLETDKLPLVIDLLNDGQNEWYAYNASENFGEENKGCFRGEDKEEEGDVFIGDEVNYCEKIFLTETPGVEIGAWVTGDDFANFEMSITNAETLEEATCSAEVSGKGQQRPSCIPLKDSSVKEPGEYRVCIKAKAGYGDKYKIATEETNPCGFSEEFQGEYTLDYEIFARQKKYAEEIKIKFDDGEMQKAGSPETDLSDYLTKFVEDRYKGNCSKGCVIPIKIYSGVQQKIEIIPSQERAGNYFVYMTFLDRGAKRELSKIFDVAESPARLNAEFQQLYLDDAGFSVPDEVGEYNAVISINEKTIISENISVAAASTIQSVDPTRTAVRYPTKFVVTLGKKENVTSYNWEFGDGSVQPTNSSQATHTYNSIGDYILKIGVNYSTGASSSKEFNISVGSAASVVPALIKNTETSLSNIKNESGNFSEFESKSIYQALNLEIIESNLAKIKQAVSKPNISEQDYEVILGELLAIKIPKTISAGIISDGISFYPSRTNINLAALKKISGNKSGNEEEYKDAIAAWNEKNIDAKISYTEIISVYEDYEEPLLKIFDVSIANSGKEETYFVVKEMENILFKENYGEKKDSGYDYFQLKTSNVVFSTTEDVDFTSVPMFLSPKLDDISLNDWTPYEEKNKNRWTIFTIIVIFTLIFLTLVWIVLQIWYKTRYENYLFKDKNNLYNMINYVNTEKNKEVDEKEIISKLGKAGWNKEQIEYALKKHANKNTGMPEIIPFDKILGLAKKMKEGGEKKDMKQDKFTTKNL